RRVTVLQTPPRARPKPLETSYFGALHDGLGGGGFPIVSQRLADRPRRGRDPKQTKNHHDQTQPPMLGPPAHRSRSSLPPVTRMLRFLQWRQTTPGVCPVSES